MAMKRTLCALVPYPLDTVPGQRFRIEQWQSDLEQAGIEVDFYPLIEQPLMDLLYQPARWVEKTAGMTAALIRRIRHIASITQYDAILIYRTACLFGPAVLERAMARLGCPILFDFDDAIYRLDTSAANRYWGWLKFPGKTAAICRLSSHIVVRNLYLANYARQYNSQVTVIPTSIDTDYYQPVPRRNDRVIVGWTGSSTSQTHLEMFAPMLRKLLSKRDVELRIISNREPDLPDDVPFTWRPWSCETQIEELSYLDIGMMPMPDDEWAKGKCALKALQYMAMGRPTVCSPVGANCDVVVHGQNGFLAETTDEWLTHLMALIDQPELRCRLGRAGRQTVVERYSMSRCAAQFAEVVRQTIAEYDKNSKVVR